MRRLEALLAITPAVRRAFPDRAEALLDRVDRWLGRESTAVGSRCLLCGRLDGAWIVARRGPRPAFWLDPQPATPGLCLPCLETWRERDDDERRLSDLRRALEATDTDGRADAVIAVLTVRIATWRGAERGRCALCGGTSPSIAPANDAVCERCLAAAVASCEGPVRDEEWADFTGQMRHAASDQDLEDASTRWDSLRRRGPPPPDAADATAIRIASFYRTYLREWLAFAGRVDGGYALELSEYLADQTETLLASAVRERARAELMGALGDLDHILERGVRVVAFGRHEEDITAQFERLCRVLLPRSDEAAAALDRGILVLDGEEYTLRRGIARIVAWMPDAPFFEIGTAARETRATAVPDDAILYVRDFAALPATDREVIAVRRARMIFLERRTLPRFDAAVRVVRLDLEHPERWPERLVDGGA